MLRILSLALTVLCLSRTVSICDEGTPGSKGVTNVTPSVLEGILRVHPKFLYKYYIVGFGDGQKCALFGEDKLKDIQVGSRIHVEGHLRTSFHEGGNDKNPSPFSRTYFIYMDVQTVRVLQKPEQKANQTSDGICQPCGLPKPSM